ncbi:TLD-domain-containing protein [Paxillus ammoniavirescens]|nr:TLD-domain-containing protein [Paxillus ammoniavirescens]
MSAPLPSIPALVPLPSKSRAQASSSSGPPPPKKSQLSESDIHRFATLFSPATPPATPTLASIGHSPFGEIPSRPAHQRKRTQGSADSDFGAFVSVPPSQDPLSLDFDFASSDVVASSTPTPHSMSLTFVSPQPGYSGNSSLNYFDRFTSSAKTAAEQNRRYVLDELLEHQDDPLYFLNTSERTQSPPPTASPDSHTLPTTKHEEIADAIMSELSKTNIIVRSQSRNSLRRSRIPLPPRLSGTASPPSISSPTGSTTSLPLSSSPPLPPAQMSSSPPAHGTLSRLSSSLVSLLPSSRPRGTLPTSAATLPPSFAASSSAPSTISGSSPFASAAITHGSPFASTPYIPPTGAPGFAGDRTWDHGFSEALLQDEELGVVDPTGLGLTVEMKAKGRRTTRKGVTLLGRGEGTVGVLNGEIADLLRPHLPALTRLPRNWTLLYSLDQHGISLNTLYSRCEPRIPSRANPSPPKGGLVAMQDAHDAVFGAWLSEGVKLERGYYGSGESFLWRYHPPRNGEPQGSLEVYKWTGRNDYVALCEPEFISFGGGDGHYGLYLDASLLDGSSAPCPTFGNPALCTHPEAARVSLDMDGAAKVKPDVSFECVGLEVWGVGPG